MKFLYPMDLTKNELRNAVIQNLATAPSNARQGQIYFDTGVNKLKVYENGAWETVGPELLAGTGITISGTTISQSGVTTTESTSSSNASHGGTIQVIDSVTTNSTGHLTGFNTKTITMPSAYTHPSHNYSTSKETSATLANIPFLSSVSVDSEGHITAGKEVNIVGGTGINITSDSSGNITFSNSYTQKDLTVQDGLEFSAGTAYDGEDARTIKHSNSVTAGTAEGNSGTLTNGDSFTTPTITFDSQGHITAKGTNSLVLPEYIGGSKITLNGTTINHDALSSAYSTSADSSTTLTNIELISGLNVDGYGHIDSANFKKLVAGNNISVTADSSGNLKIDSSNTEYSAGTKLNLSSNTFNHDSTTRTDTSSTKTASHGSTVSVIDELTSDSTGHITAANVKTITLPDETQLNLNTNGSGVLLSAQSVSGHTINLTKTNSTENKLTVGELLVSTSGVGNGNVVIQGDLTVEGTTTSIDTTELKIEDNVLTLNAGATTAALNAGLEVNRGTDPNYEITFVEATQDFRIGEAGSLQPVLTRSEEANLVNGDLLVWDSTNYRAVGKTTDEVGLAEKYVETISTVDADTSYTITHNLGTEDVTWSLRDNDNEFLLADVSVIDSNSISVGLGQINGTTSIKATVIG